MAIVAQAPLLAPLQAAESKHLQRVSCQTRHWVWGVADSIPTSGGGLRASFQTSSKGNQRETPPILSHTIRIVAQMSFPCHQKILGWLILREQAQSRPMFQVSIGKEERKVAFQRRGQINVQVYLFFASAGRFHAKLPHEVS